MDSFAHEVEQVREKSDRFPNSLSNDRYKFEWTAAIFVYFKHLARDNSKLGCPVFEGTICPESDPYKGEFLTDFAIWEPEYGLRIACESQSYEGKNNETRIACALDKLLHVKADIKVLVFEDSHSDGNILNRLRDKFLTNYITFHTPESFLFLQWDNNAVKRYLWCPNDGMESELTEI